MVTRKKTSLVDVFAGSPWEVARVMGLLNAAYINVSVKEDSKEIRLLVPSEHYSAAIRAINSGNL